MKNKLKNLDVLVIVCKLTEPDFKKIKKSFIQKKHLLLAMDPKTQIFLKNKKENFVTSNVSTQVVEEDFAAGFDWVIAFLKAPRYRPAVRYVLFPIYT